ncbi:F-box/kelch-repeat protein At3g06240-like [Coffea eugenioides]|uniref:F-box/kelch-repeat protein At3g06240-like n=1 Tax=Coffea eugenioides TaxID=49369 RepID=UPI000F604653|nr:F-box/kelch-repeat protein At3g06240-like [Coffea eugenioides]
MAMISHLPRDLLGDILKFLPVKTLCRFKCVSKSWHSVIQSREFVKLHLQIHQHKCDGEKIFMPTHFCSAYNDPDFYILDTSSLADSENPRAKQVEIPVGRRCIILSTIVCACNGLLFIALDDERVLFVWNPSTGKLRRIPTLKSSSSSHFDLLYGFGYDSLHDDYKILRVCYDNGTYDCWLFSLKENTWRKLNDRVLNGYGTCNIDQVLNDAYTRAEKRAVIVCVNDSAYFIVQKEGKKYKVLSFSLAEERFVEMLPPPCEVVGAVPILKVLAGRLSLQWRTSANHDFVVWSLMDDGNSSYWTKIISILYSETLVGLEPICMMRNGHFVVRTKSERELFIYDMKKKAFQQVFKHESLDVHICSFKNTVVYTESLVHPCDYGDKVEEWTSAIEDMKESIMLQNKRQFCSCCGEC